MGSRGLSSRLTETSDLPGWIEDVDRDKVEDSKVLLRLALKKLHGNDKEAQIGWLQAVKKRVENGLVKLSPVKRVALTEVLSDLVLNGKINEKET